MNSVMVGLRLSNKTIDSLKTKAQEEFRSTGNLIKAGIHEYIEHKKKKKK